MSTDFTPDIFDAAALRRNFGDDVAFVGRLLAKFEMRYPAQLDAMVEALSRGEGIPAAEAAHRLAGETSVFYAIAARQMALSVEDLARASQLPEARAATDALRHELGRLVEALRGFPRVV